jgi:opacity protein-like surface antigen
MVRNTLLVMCAVFLIAAAMSAHVNDVSAGFGRTFISDQGVQGTILGDSNIHFGDGFSYSLSYGRRLLDSGFASLSVEVPFVHDPTIDLNFGANIVPKSYSAIFLTPAIRINAFPHAAVSPWISGGGGFGHFSPSSTLVAGGASAAKSTTKGAVELGAGLDIALIGNLKLRGELRDFYTGEPDFNIKPQRYMHNYFAGAGIVWSF